jgi:filamentous hemagglutinin family protein
VYGENRLDVYQNRNKIVLDWNTFDIGRDAETQFHQNGGSALNRIYDQDPSKIYGKLTADGKIYLINQNGILFGPGSRINVHSLTASSLKLKFEPEPVYDDDNIFIGWKWEDHFARIGGEEAVSNHGDIQADKGGAVFLIGPEVENAGTIDAAGGQVALIAGNDVEMKLVDRTFPYVWVTRGEKGETLEEKGTAVNTETGRITADAGLAGMYGKTVNQDGYIRSITAITNNGRIELKASEKVATGPSSRTITPISDDPEKVHSSFQLAGGQIVIAGLDQKKIVNISTNEISNQTTSSGKIEHGGEITAKSGTITMDAKDRIYLGAGSSLDASGEWVDRSFESVPEEVV